MLVSIGQYGSTNGLQDTFDSIVCLANLVAIKFAVTNILH